MSFICGNAYLIDCQFTKPPKKKYAVCVCDYDKKPLLFFINSSPRTRFAPSSQLKIFPIDLAFLRKESYINTADVITCDIPYTCDIIKNFGPVPDHVKQKIKKIVHESETLPNRFIKIIISML